MYSYSRISTFLQCPKKYEFTYIQNLPKQMNNALIKGSKVHSIFENIDTFIKYKQTKSNNTSKLGFNNTTLVENVNSSKLENNILINPKLLNTFETQEYSSIVENFIKSPLGELLKYPNSREVEIFLDKDFNPALKDKYFVGYIDRVNFTNTGIEIIDFKTGKYKDIKYQDFNQLGLYGIYVMKKYNLDKVKLRYVYVEHNKENTLEIDIPFINELTQKYKNIINELENTKEFKKCVTRLCDYCDYKDKCFGDKKNILDFNNTNKLDFNNTPLVENKNSSKLGNFNTTEYTSF